MQGILKVYKGLMVLTRIWVSFRDVGKKAGGVQTETDPTPKIPNPSKPTNPPNRSKPKPTHPSKHLQTVTRSPRLGVARQGHAIHRDTHFSNSVASGARRFPTAGGSALGGTRQVKETTKQKPFFSKNQRS